MRRLAVPLAGLLLPAWMGGHELPPPSPETTRAARQLLATLRPATRERCVFGLEDPDRFTWGYLPGRRRGVPLKEMNEAERLAVRALLHATLSSRGEEKVQGVVELEGILRRMEGDFRDPDLYYFALFGTPSEERAWAWRFEGHHLSLNFASWMGGIVGATPMFFGAHPARVAEGPRTGWRLLGPEEDLARELLASLDPAQRARATLSARAPSDIVLGPGRKSVPDAAGLAYSEMSAGERQTLERLIGEYLGNLRPEAAAAQRARLEKAGLGGIRFAWAGGDRPGEGHYYRIQGPTFLIEYDNTQDGANHVHSVWRDLQDDFGGDVLRRHYAENH